MPTFNKKRYRTEKDILNNPKADDDLETAFRDMMIKDEADKLKERLIARSGARFYTDLVLELAKREIGNITEEEIE